MSNLLQSLPLNMNEVQGYLGDDAKAKEHVSRFFESSKQDKKEAGRSMLSGKEVNTSFILLTYTYCREGSLNPNNASIPWLRSCQVILWSLCSRNSRLHARHILYSWQENTVASWWSDLWHGKHSRSYSIEHRASQLLCRIFHLHQPLRREWHVLQVCQSQGSGL